MRIVSLIACISLVLCLTGCFWENISSDTVTKDSNELWETTTKASETTAPATTAVPQISTTAKSEILVWIPRTGEKYHINDNCSRMDEPTQVPLDNAIAMGYEPCGNRYK